MPDFTYDVFLSHSSKDKKRANNPPVGMVTPETDPDAGQKTTYEYDPHLDPQLVWAGKAEHTSFEVPTVSLHVHERIDPRTIIEATRKRNGGHGNGQMMLFEQAEENPPLREAIEFYKHAKGWTNRMIAGDSLLVMNSLLEKEGMAGKVQMNTDLLTDDLKKKRSSNESFWMIGQPDVQVRKVKDGSDKGKIRIEVCGFDYYNPIEGKIESGDTSKIAMWMLDTDYDGRSLYPSQVFFPMAGAKDGWARLAKNLKAEIDEELIEAYRGTISLPFAPGKYKRAAVKIIDDRGIESLKIVEVG